MLKHLPSKGFLGTEGVRVVPITRDTDRAAINYIPTSDAEPQMIIQAESYTQLIQRFIGQEAAKNQSLAGKRGLIDLGEPLAEPGNRPSSKQRVS